MHRLALENTLMNRRRQTVPITSIVCFGLLLCSAGPRYAWGQDADAPTAGSIADTIKGSAVISRSDRTAIEAFVQQQVQRLQDGTPADQSKAREALISAANGNRAQTPTLAFYDAYCSTLIPALSPVIQSSDAKVRLNGAIVVGKVAAEAQTTHLRDLAVALTKDPSPAVALWGVKAARAIIPAVLRDPALRNQDTLLPAITPCVVAHSETLVSGHMAEEAYHALTLDMFSGRTIANDMIAAVVGHTQDLLAARVAQYQVKLPGQPLAERTATQFLIHPQVWEVQTMAQRQRTLQLLSDVISLAAQRMALAGSDRRADLQQMIELTAKAIAVAADIKGATGLSAAATPLTTMERQADPQQVLQLVGAIYPAIVAVPEFAQTTAPPQIAASSTTSTTEPEEAEPSDVDDSDSPDEDMNAEPESDEADDAGSPADPPTGTDPVPAEPAAPAAP
jgi:hypothetical protein